MTRALPGSCGEAPELVDLGVRLVHTLRQVARCGSPWGERGRANDCILGRPLKETCAAYTYII